MSKRWWRDDLIPKHTQMRSPYIVQYCPDEVLGGTVTLAAYERQRATPHKSVTSTHPPKEGLVEWLLRVLADRMLEREGEDGHSRIAEGDLQDVRAELVAQRVPLVLPQSYGPSFP